MNTCPFKPGDVVVYRPSSRGRSHNVMTDLQQLEVGHEYTVARMERGNYVVLRGFENSPTGGLFWTEFALKK